MKIDKATVMPAAMTATAEAEAPRRRYWFGTMPGAPKRALALAGVSFNFKTGDFDGVGGQHGMVSDLSEAEVTAILKALSRKVARKAGNRGLVVDTTSRSYRPHKGDKPLAAYVYLIPEDIAARVVGAPQFRTNRPPSVLEMLDRGPEEKDWMLPEPEPLDPHKEAKLRQDLEAKQRELDNLKRALAGKASTAPEGDAGEEPEGEDAEATLAEAERRSVLDGYTVAELQNYAEQQGVDLGKATKKAAIIDALIKAGK